jgi:hypothetical protein
MEANMVDIFNKDCFIDNDSVEFILKEKSQGEAQGEILLTRRRKEAVPERPKELPSDEQRYVPASKGNKAASYVWTIFSLSTKPEHKGWAFCRQCEKALTFDTIKN